MLSQPKVLRTFQRALNSYDNAATVQRDCAAKLAAYLHHSDTPSTLERIFEFGCGTGFLTQHIVAQFNVDHFIVNDLVDDCRFFLESSDIDKSSFDFIGGDVEQIELPRTCDVICSSSCIQWSTDQQKLLIALTSALKKSGTLALSSFSQGHFKELESLESNNSIRKPLNYWSPEAWQKHLQADYNIDVIETDEVTVWFNSVRELLLHLRLTGVNGNAGQSWNQQSLSNFVQQYRQRFEVEGKVPLSYRPIYIIAHKKA